MLPAFGETKDMNMCLYVLGTLSPRAKDTIENEEYRAELIEEEANDPQKVMESALLCAVADLHDIGVRFDIDLGLLIEDKETLSNALDVMALLLPNSLYMAIQTDDDIRTLIRHCLDGSIGDGDTIIQTYLHGLGGLDVAPAIVPTLTDFLDAYSSDIMQTDVFTDYLTNLMDMYTTERLTPDALDDGHQRYTRYLKDTIARGMDALNVVTRAVTSTPRVDSPTGPLNARIRNWVHDLTAPVNFHLYSYIFLERPETLPDSIIPRHAKQWFWYKVGTPLFLEYWTNRPTKTPEYADYLAMLIGAYIYNDTVAGYQSVVDAISEKLAMTDPDQIAVTLSHAYKGIDDGE